MRQSIWIKRTPKHQQSSRRVGGFMSFLHIFNCFHLISFSDIFALKKTTKLWPFFQLQGSKTSMAASMSPRRHSMAIIMFHLCRRLTTATCHQTDPQQKKKRTAGFLRAENLDLPSGKFAEWSPAGVPDANLRRWQRWLEAQQLQQVSIRVEWCLPTQRRAAK